LLDVSSAVRLVLNFAVQDLKDLVPSWISDSLYDEHLKLILASSKDKFISCPKCAVLELF